MQMDPKFEGVAVAAAVVVIAGAAAVVELVDFHFVVEQHRGHSSFHLYYCHDKIAENQRLGKYFHNTLNFLLGAEVVGAVEEAGLCQLEEVEDSVVPAMEEAD
jgi:demethoxyubiquinone hydroxylase (CLK1/Coq7/Cat5 family)